MRLGQQFCTGPAMGEVRDQRHGIRVSVRFDPGQFEEIRQRAIAENTSLSEQVRCLAEWGLETLDDDTRATRQAQG